MSEISSVARVDNWRGEYSYLVFYMINFFWNLLFSRSVNTTMRIFAPPIIDAGYATERNMFLLKSNLKKLKLEILDLDKTQPVSSFTLLLYWICVWFLSIYRHIICTRKVPKIILIYPKPNFTSGAPYNIVFAFNKVQIPASTSPQRKNTTTAKITTPTTVELQSSTNRPNITDVTETQTATKDRVSLPTHLPNVSSTPVPTGRKNETQPLNLTTLVEVSNSKELSPKSLKNLITSLESLVAQRNFSDTAAKVCFMQV